MLRPASCLALQVSNLSFSRTNSKYGVCMSSLSKMSQYSTQILQRLRTEISKLGQLASMAVVLVQSAASPFARHHHRGPDDLFCTPAAAVWCTSESRSTSESTNGAGSPLMTMQPRTPGTANSSMSLPESPSTSTPSLGAPTSSFTCTANQQTSLVD